MKRFKPHCWGHYLLYALVVISVAEAVWTLVGQVRGTASEVQSSFSMFSYLIAALGVYYAKTYWGARVEISDKSVHIVTLLNIRPPQGAKRGSVLFRQGDTDLRVVDKRFSLSDLVQYGWVENLGVKPIDVSKAKPDAKLFPVHEMAFITSDNKRYHLNAAVYKKEQVEEMIGLIQQATGIAPAAKREK